MELMEIEKTNRMNALFEFYAALLTDKQMNYIELYYACLLYTSPLTVYNFGLWLFGYQVHILFLDIGHRVDTERFDRFQGR